MFFVLVYALAHLATYFLVIHVASKPHRTLAKRHPELAAHPFARIDVDKWNVVKCAPFYMTFWPRFLAALANCFFYATWVTVCMIGVDRN